MSVDRELLECPENFSFRLYREESVSCIELQQWNIEFLRGLLTLTAYKALRDTTAV